MTNTKKTEEETKDLQPKRAPGLTLDTLRPAAGSRKKRDRVGRGIASGSGKTSGRGHRGQGQRSGYSRKRGFEGGQMPVYRKVPKVDGFRLVNPRKWLEINVCDLGRYLLADETELTYEMLTERGFLRKGHDGVRLLGKGECAQKVNIHVHHATPSAKEKLEKAGGSVTLMAAPNLAKKTKKAKKERAKKERAEERLARTQK